MCETKEEVETEVRRLAEAGELIGIHAIDPDLTQSLVLYFVATLELLDEWYEPLILPGLHRFPSHYYVSWEFMLSPPEARGHSRHSGGSRCIPSTISLKR